MTQKLNTDNGLQGRWTKTTGYNIILATHRLNSSVSTYEIAKDWSNSEEYQKAIELRKMGANTNAIIVDGV